MKLWVAWEVLRWLVTCRGLVSRGFHPKYVTPPCHGFLKANTIIKQTSSSSSSSSHHHHHHDHDHDHDHHHHHHHDHYNHLTGTKPLPEPMLTKMAHLFFYCKHKNKQNNTNTTHSTTFWHNANQQRLTSCSTQSMCFQFSSPECLSAPNHIASVLFRFMFKPLNLANWFMILIVSSISCLSFKNRVISSAYNSNLWHCLWAPGNCMPVILLDCRVFTPKSLPLEWKLKERRDTLA